MKSTGILLSAALLSGLMLGQARAECQIADARLEEAILHQANLRGSANRQSVRDLRRLRMLPSFYNRMDGMLIASASWVTSVNLSPGGNDHLGRQR